MKESNWDLNNLVERTTLVKTFDWSVTDLSGTILQSYILPNDLLVNHLNKTPFSNMTFWRGNMHIHFQVNATPFHQGLLKAVYIPLTLGVQNADIMANSRSMSINHHVDLFANTNSSVEIVIPFRSPYHYLNIEMINTVFAAFLGTLNLVVFNRLDCSATATQTVTVSVFCHFSDNEFKVPRAVPLAIQTPFRAQSLLDPFKKIISKHLIPNNFIRDGIDAITGLIGLDKPSDYSRQPPSKVDFTGDFNYANGNVHLNKLSVFPAETAMCDTEILGTSEDEMDMSYLLGKECYLGSFSIDVNAAPGLLIGSFPACPITIPFLNRSSDSTLLQYLSLPFAYWSGGLKVKIQAVSTSMQTCKLMVTFNPTIHNPVTAALDLQQISTQYGMAFEMNQGSNFFEFEVPYVAPTSVLRIPNSNDYGNDGYSSYTSMGSINITVLNRLICPNNTPTRVEFNVYIAAASDFKLYTLSWYNSFVPDILPTLKPFRAQSAVAPLSSDKQNEDMILPVIVTGPTQPIQDIHQSSNFGKSYTLRDYFRKYQRFDPINLTLEQDFFQINLAQLLSNAPRNGVFSHFLSMYRAIHGSLRFKFMIEITNADLTQVLPFTEVPLINVYYLSPDTNYTALTPADISQFRLTPTALPDNFTRTTVVSSNSVQRFIEFEVPYNVQFNFSVIADNRTVFVNSEPTAQLGSILINLMTTSPAPTNKYFITVVPYVSFSDETRVMMPYRIPFLIRPNGPVFPDTFSLVSIPNFLLTPVF